MNDRKIIIDVLKGVALLVLVLIVCGKTMGGGAILVAGAAFVMAITGRIGWAIIGYCLFPLMVVMNPYVLPKSGLTGVALRLGPMFLTVGLMISGASRPGRHQIPMGLIWLYLLVAGLCSMQGYYPEISYLKIVNCAGLFLGLHLGFRNIDQRPADVMTIRKFMLVMTSFIILGSIAVLILFPGAAYITSLSNIIQEEGMDAAEVVARTSGGLKLFAGIMNHSQTLATVLPCSLAWLACDMFFIEKRISKFHVVLILLGLPLVYLTRSRGALLNSTVAALLIYFYCLNKINIRQRIRAKLRMAMMLMMVFVTIGGAVLEVRDHTISRWLRKTEDLSGDQRGLGEAFTSSRQGKAEENLADFRRNPLLGTGFQVTADMQYTFRHAKGLVLSASLEKSILPLMVLGETGVVGFSVFLAYLIVFYVGCLKKRYYCCATLHTVFLVTNMAEASYFSPGGMGGYLWVLCVGGGFVIDMVALYHRRMEEIARRQKIEWMMRRGVEG